MRPRKFLMVALVAATAAACAENAPPPETHLGYRDGYNMDAVMAVLRNPYADPMLRQYAMDILYKTSGLTPPRKVLHCEPGETDIDCYDR